MSLIVVLIVTVAMSTAVTGTCIYDKMYNTFGVRIGALSMPHDEYSTAVDYPTIVNGHVLISAVQYCCCP